MKKTLSILLIISFTLHNISLSYGYNNTLFTHKSHAQRHIQADQDYIDIVKDPSLLTINNSLGRVVEYHKGKGSATIVHIQDRHIDYTTQKNISEIIKYINQWHNINLICLEGSSGIFDTSFYDNFQDTPSKQRVADFFLEKGLFTGAEFFKIMHKDIQARAIGVEDQDLYSRNLTAYRQHERERLSAIDFIRSTRLGLERVKQPVYNEDLKELDSTGLAYKNKQIGLSEYLLKLKQYADKADINLAQFHDLRQFIEQAEKEKLINFTIAQAERDALIKHLTDNADGHHVRELLQASMDFRIGKVSDIEFHAYLTAFIKEYSLEVKDYANLIDYAKYLESSKHINTLNVFEQAQDLESIIAYSFCTNPQQTRLLEYSKTASILEDLYSLKLSPRQFDYMNDNQDFFDIGDIQEFVGDMSVRYGMRSDMPIYPGSGKGQHARYAQEFYDLAVARDAALVGNTLAGMRQYHTDKAILVAGGFHTKGITDILKQEGISYIVICPVIGLEDCDEIYSRRLNNRLLDPADIEEFLQSTLAPPSFINSGDPIASQAERLFGFLLGIAEGFNAGQITQTSSHGQDTETARLLAGIKRSFDNFVPTQIASVPASNMLMKARTLIFLSLLYAESAEQHIKGHTKRFSHYDMPIETILKKLLKRLDEVENIFKVVYSNEYLGPVDDQQGIEPALNALDNARQAIDILISHSPDDLAGLTNIVETQIIPNIHLAWRQTETEFVKRRLMALSVTHTGDSDQAQISSTDTETGQGQSKFLTLANKTIKWAWYTIMVFSWSASIYFGIPIYMDWQEASKTKKAAFVLEESMRPFERHAIADSIYGLYDLVEDLDTGDLSVNLGQEEAYSVKMRFEIGETALIFQKHIKTNMDFIEKYAREYNIDPLFLASIILTEQRDMDNQGFIQEVSTDRMAASLRFDTSIGLAQIKISTFKRVCAGMIWPQFKNQPETKHLSRAQIIELLHNPETNIMVSAMVIADAKKTIPEDLVLRNFDLRLAQAYTSSVRGEVPEPPYTTEQLRQERYRTYVYAHWVSINKDLISRLLESHNDDIGHDRERLLKQLQEQGIIHPMPYVQEKSSSSGDIPLLTQEEIERAGEIIYRDMRDIVLNQLSGSMGSYITGPYSEDVVLATEHYHPNPYFNPLTFAEEFSKTMHRHGFYRYESAIKDKIFEYVVERINQQEWMDIFKGVYMQKLDNPTMRSWGIRDISRLREKLTQIDSIFGIFEIDMSKAHMGIFEYLQANLDEKPIQEVEALKNAVNIVNNWSRDQLDRAPGDFMSHVQQIHAIAMAHGDHLEVREGLSQQRRFEVNHTERLRYFPHSFVLESMLFSMDLYVSSDVFKKQHPILQAAEIYLRLTDLQFFPDGNRRTAKLIMDHYLIRNYLPALEITAENKDEFIRLMRFAMRPEEIADFIADQLLQQSRKNIQNTMLTLSLEARQELDNQLLSLRPGSAELPLVQQIENYLRVRLEQLGLNEIAIPKIVVVDSSQQMPIGMQRFKVKLHRSDDHTYMMIDKSALVQGKAYAEIQSGILDRDIMHEIFGHILVRVNEDLLQDQKEGHIGQENTRNRILYAKTAEEIVARVMTLITYHCLQQVKPELINNTIREYFDSLGLDIDYLDITGYVEAEINNIMFNHIEIDMHIYKELLLQKDIRFALGNEAIIKVHILTETLFSNYVVFAPPDIEGSPAPTRGSSAGMVYVNDALLGRVQAAIQDSNKDFYGQLSPLGIKDIVFITTARSFTEEDILFIKKFDPNRVKIITAYPEPADILSSVGITAETLKWQDTSIESAISIVAARERNPARVVITVTSDSLTDAIEQRLRDQMKRDTKKGTVIISSMHGARQPIMIGKHIIAEHDIIFSVAALAGMQKADEQYIFNNDIIRLEPLPPIDDKVFEKFIEHLVNIKASRDAAAMAA